MIHEINPHKFHVEYVNEKATAKDKVCVFTHNQLWIRKQETIDFMRCEELPRKYWEQLTYLFAVDDENYFYMEMEEELAKSLFDKEFRLVLHRQELRSLGPKYAAFIAVTAFHLDGWYSSNHFCGKCGSVVVHDTKERMLLCPSCKNRIYPRINPAVIVAVTDKNRLLLTKYRNRIYTNYALVAGFVEIGETFEDTVRREVMEEAGLLVKNIRYYGSQPWGFGDNILAGYICEVDGNTDITMDEDELSLAYFVEREEIPVTYTDSSLTNEMICAFKEGKY